MGEEPRTLRPGLTIWGASGLVRLLPSFLFVCLLVVSSSAAERRYDIPVANSPQKGPADAPVTIIEFLDFQ